MKKLTGKIIALCLSIGLIMSLIIGTTMSVSTIRMNQKKIAELNRVLREDFDRNARIEVETAISMLQAVYNRHKAGDMGLNEAKKLGANLLRDLRYDKDGYFWADTTEGTNVVLLGRATEGTNRYDAQDKKGNYYVRDFVRFGGAEGGGYTDYWFTRKDGTEPLPKRSYTLVFRPFGWVVGTGNYIDDIDLLISAEETRYRAEIMRDLAIMAAMILAALGVSAAVAVYVGRRITRPITAITGALGRMAELDLGSYEDTGALASNADETGSMAKALVLMRDSVAGVIMKIKGVSADLAASAEEIKNSMEEQKLAVTEIVRSISNINLLTQSSASGAEEMAGSSESIAALSENLKQTSDSFRV